MDNTITQKVAYLESLGVEVHDYDPNEGMNSGVYFSTSEGDYEILFEDFEVGDMLGDIYCRSTEYSACCGEVIDTDYRICPSCKEHV